MDIPLPESGFPTFDFGNTPTTFYSLNARATDILRGDYEPDTNVVDIFSFQYVANTKICGNFPTNFIKNGAVTTIRRSFSQTVTGTWYHPANDIVLSVQETDRECFLEDGTYRVIIDLLEMTSAVKIRRLQIYAYDYEGEYIEFTINNNIATFNAQTVTLNKEHFIQGSGTYIIKSVIYSGDRIIKVN